MHSVSYLPASDLGHAAIAGRYPQGRQTQAHYATALNAGRTGAVDAERRLDQLVLDATQPVFARATALLLLTGYATPACKLRSRLP